MPRSYSLVTRYGWPPSVTPELSTSGRLGRPDTSSATRASQAKRWWSKLRPPTSMLNTLIATVRPLDGSRPRYTTDVEPLPMRASTS